MDIKKHKPQSLDSSHTLSESDPLRIVLKYDGLEEANPHQARVTKIMTWHNASLEPASLEGVENTVHSLRTHLFKIEKCTFDKRWGTFNKVFEKTAELVVPASQMTHAQMAEMDDDDLIDAIFSSADPEEVTCRIDGIIEERDALSAAPEHCFDACPNMSANWPYYETGKDCLSGSVGRDTFVIDTIDLSVVNDVQLTLTKQDITALSKSTDVVTLLETKIEPVRYGIIDVMHPNKAVSGHDAFGSTLQGSVTTEASLEGSGSTISQILH